MMSDISEETIVKTSVLPIREMVFLIFSTHDCLLAAMGLKLRVFTMLGRCAPVNRCTNTFCAGYLVDTVSVHNSANLAAVLPLVILTQLG
jgi:hypothetical protein